MQYYDALKAAAQRAGLTMAEISKRQRPLDRLSQRKPWKKASVKLFLTAEAMSIMDVSQRSLKQLAKPD